MLSKGIDKGFVISPGRVNLLGEHVDYNDGMVLPAAIDRSVKISFQRGAGSHVSISAPDMNDECQFSIDNLESKTTIKGEALPDWALYPAGVIWNIQRRGFVVGGFSAEYRSTIPIGAGLSSSAAVEVGFAVVCESLGGWRLDRMEMAQLCQEAEREYVGVNCGLMDQFACACGVQDHALMLDTRSLAYKPLPLPEHTSLVIADSTLRRSLITSAYNDRRRDCETAVAYFNKIDPQINSLRDLDQELLFAHENKLPPHVFRHARHVVEEIDRVNRAVRLLEENNAEGFGKLMFATHASLRDLFEVSRPELDILVEIAGSIDGCFGARLTGAGFGGCTVNLIQESHVEEFIGKLKTVYKYKTGLEAAIFATRASRGAFLKNQ